MISTALALQEATGNAVIDISTMTLAKSIFDNYETMSKDEMANALFAYSAHLSAVTATLVTHAVMTESQLDELLATIEEMETMGKEAL